MSPRARSRSVAKFAFAGALASLLFASASPAKRGAPEPQLGQLDGNTWLLAERARGIPHRLGSERRLPLLRRFVEPAVERHGEWRGFWLGRFGPSSWLEGRLSWSMTACEPREELPRGMQAPTGPSWSLKRPLSLELGAALASSMNDMLTSELFAPSIGEAVIAPAGRCKPWEKPYSATLARYGGEHDTIKLLECDGSVAVDALDRLSVIARPPGTPRPELPLPLDPAQDGVLSGEWLPEVRLLNPRLVWAVARLASMFPKRVMYVISGYRRQAHDGLHNKGRALDIFITGVSNEDLFRACRKMKDVGCGFYPHNRFVHVDVRAPFTGHALWIDASKPGEKTQYVDSWPGVVGSGALSFGNDAN